MTTTSTQDMQQVESVEHLFQLIWQKIDPETGKTRSQEENITQLKEYAGKMKQSRQESTLLLQLFMDRRPHIKWQSYD